MGDYIGDYYRGYSGDTRSLDKGTYGGFYRVVWRCLGVRV